ncbi:MAG: hypothetical protein CL916_11505, partial [Deltaproteobacteria bacterium]|nr:hypothetical protein [Deltaproteobacteria bacterium]
MAVLDFEGTTEKSSSIADLIMKGILKNKRPTIVIKMSDDKIHKIRKEKGESSNSCPLECKLTLAKELEVQYVLNGQLRVEAGFQILTVKLYETKESNLQMVKTIVGQDLSYQAERLGTEIVRFGFRKSNFNGKKLLRQLENKNKPKHNYPSRVPSIKIKPESDAEMCTRGVPQQCTKLGSEAQDPKIAMQFYEKGCDGGDSGMWCAGTPPNGCAWG